MTHQSRSVITVDGLAGSGKTALSRALASRLGFVHFSSGLLYRAVGWLALRNGIPFSDIERLQKMIPQHLIELRLSDERSSTVSIDGELLGLELHTPEVSEATSCTSQFHEVRELLLDSQRSAYSGEAIVAEGRDMGTVVFPNATLKFFIVADPAVRVQRRLRQLYGDLEKLPAQRRKSLEAEIRIEITERDARDSERRVSPTVAAPDATLIDNSVESLTVVVESMYSAARQRGLVRL